MWDVERFATWMNLSNPQEPDSYSVPIGFLKEIGAKPVLNIPKDGDKVVVWNYPENKYIRVTNGKTESGCIATYSEYYDGRLFFDTWENWKPFNPEELE